ncbi:MAG TPA: methylmalonyl-CoA mutase family protein [Thermoanaerobaculia bacterium]|jgi:methylmalonyl-CoA mutase N-terminal domain/subunit|nr:methylmalonyl-CoA mutase family protein [Thermoanaerobaculia bacterium]
MTEAKLLNDAKSFFDADDLAVRGFDSDTDLGEPGRFPFTRGPQPLMYRGKLWTMRQYAGFSTAAKSNERYRYLLERGTTGLSVAFDLPTQIGLDSDDPRARGEVGNVGVAIDSIEDMETLLDAIPLDLVSISMTINAPASILLALVLVVAERRGMAWSTLSGTIQNDILKEYAARGTYIFPPSPSLRIVTDIFEFCATEVPRWNTISISGYHIREAGSTVVQEVAFTLANGLQYVQAAVERGLDVDTFAPRISFYFNAHNDFLEEVAKFRAARKLWAELMRERYKPKNPKSLALRFHAQTAGSTLTAQQPENNVVRVAYQAMAAVLGGCQSLHTNSRDEALALPTEESAKIALRTQQVLAYETGVPQYVDPLAGSYLVESLTLDIERQARDLIERIDAMGGARAAIESGFMQREIGESAYQAQRALEEKRAIVVGVNEFVEDGSMPLPISAMDESVEREQVERLRAFRSRRTGDVKGALSALNSAAQDGRNLMPFIVDCVRQDCTVGEIVGTMKETFGEHRDQGF